MSDETSSVGRPTKYEDRFCEEVISYMGQGYSLTAFAGNISVARSTINEWMGAHDEFSEAVKIGQAKRTAILEIGLLEGDSGPRVTSRIFALKNAAPEEWRDKVQTEISGPDGGPVQFGRVEMVIVDPTNPSLADTNAAGIPATPKTGEV